MSVGKDSNMSEEIVTRRGDLCTECNADFGEPCEPDCPMHEEAETFTLPTSALERLQKEVDKLNRRADRLGFPHMSIKVIDTKEVPHPIYVKRLKERESQFPGSVTQYDWDRVPMITMTELSLEGDAPKIKGYEFVGTLDHYSIPGEVIVRTVPGQTVPEEFHDRDATCDHCQKIRLRTETFVLRREGSNQHIAVGRQCVRDFIGYDVSALARYLERWRDLRAALSDEDDERYWGGGRIVMTFNKIEVLASTLGVIRVRGWKAKSACNEYDIPTAGHVLDLFVPPTFTGNNAAQRRAEYKAFVADVVATRDEDLEVAEKVIEWLDEQEDRNEYMHNLKVLRKAEGIPTNMFGYWCSTAAAYLRAQEQLRLEEVKNKGRLNEYIGEIKERLKFNITVVTIRHIEGVYGVVNVHNMRDDQGRTLVWFANTNSGMEEGKSYTIKGTVKKHDEFKGWKQTVLNRVKVI